MASNNKPVNTRRCGNITAAIWQNSREKGPFFSRRSRGRTRIRPGSGAMEPHSV